MASHVLQMRRCCVRRSSVGRLLKRERASHLFETPINFAAEADVCLSICLSCGAHPDLNWPFRPGGRQIARQTDETALGTFADDYESRSATYLRNYV